MFRRCVHRLPTTLGRQHTGYRLRLFSAAAPGESNSMSELKVQLAKASLKQVPIHGWTQDAITAAAVEDPNMSISLSGMLTPSELVSWIMDDWNKQLEGMEGSVFEKIQWRLEQVIPFVESGKWHEGMALGLKDPLTTQGQLHAFVDLVAPVGSSTVYKTGLGAIFVATELHLLSDQSLGYEETWKFLQLRLNELDQGQFVNIMENGSIPMAATTAVATSLLEGLTSLVFPPETPRKTSGTQPSDYEPKK